MTEALVVQNMVKKYPSFCLDINHLAFPRGSILGLVGPNGAGKSTLMKLMLNLVHPDKGDIWILGRHFRRQELEIKSLVGYVPEECRVYEEVTPAWAGQFISGFYSSWDHRFYTKLLEKFRLPGNTKVKELSKGSKMKLSLCLALAHRPELLLLDEPTSGLDPVARHKLLQELLEVVQDETRSVFLSTHTVSDIEKIADYMAFLRGGRLVYMVTGGMEEGFSFSGLAFGVSFLIVYGFISQTSYQEGRQGSLAFLRTLPVSCAQITGTTFLVLAIFALVATLGALITLTLVQLAGFSVADSLRDLWLEGVLALGPVLTLGAIMLWVFYRFGHVQMGYAMR